MQGPDCTVHLMQLHSRAYRVHYCGFCPQKICEIHPYWIVLKGSLSNLTWGGCPKSQLNEPRHGTSGWSKYFKQPLKRCQSKPKSTRIRLRQLAYSWFELDSIRIYLPDRQDVTCLVSAQARWESDQSNGYRSSIWFPSRPMRLLCTASRLVHILSLHRANYT
jgi:hypothetical protein